MGSITKNGHGLYITSGENLILLDMESGKDELITVPDLKVTESKEFKVSQVNESRNIVSLEFSKCGFYTAIALENKWIIVYDKHFQIKRSFMTTRIASKVHFTCKNDILVADKSGDVYLFEENNDKGILLLGHRSVILDLTLSNCEKYLITCDRDEKIRVSCYPNCYNIVSYCLGHSEFVTMVKLLNDKVLVSCSGDGTVRFWHYIEGIEINIVDTNQYIEDKELLQKFASKFEKTEISALPVNDMDIHFNDDYYLAVSICGCNLIQLYKVNSQNICVSYLTKFIIEEPFWFCLNDILYTFCKKLLAYSYLDASYICLNLDIFEKLSEKYKNVMKHSDENFIQLLYKRKFDNVQEYLERKKQRTEIK